METPDLKIPEGFMERIRFLDDCIKAGKYMSRASDVRIYDDYKTGLDAASALYFAEATGEPIFTREPIKLKSYYNVKLGLEGMIDSLASDLAFNTIKNHYVHTWCNEYCLPHWVREEIFAKATQIRGL